MFGRWIMVMAAWMLATGAACTGAHREVASPKPTTSASFVTTTVTPTAVWGTTDIASGGSIVVSAVNGRITVGYSSTEHPGPAVISFAALSVSPVCIARAVLQVSLSAPPRTRPVAAYPVDPRYADLAPGEWIEGWSLLLDNRPRGDFEFTGSEGEADVTELVKTYVQGGPFPSKGKVLPAGSPLVLSVQPRDLTSPATFDLLTDVPPRLSLSRRC